MKEASDWGQKLHKENEELLKQADTHRNIISKLSVEVEEEKRKREQAEEKTMKFRKWEEELQEDMANLQRDLDAKVASESRAIQELNKVQSSLKNAEKMVTAQNETINERRSENQKLKERLEYNKKRRRDMTRVLNDYDTRLKVNAVKKFIHSAKFEDGLAKGLNMGREINFPAEPFVSFLEDCLPSHTSSAKLPSPFKYLKNWTEEVEKKDRPENSRRGERRR
ncbi:hypothetical protein Dimus_024323 [Dionaea muscipula]